MKKKKQTIEAEGLMTFGELENGLKTMDFTSLSDVKMEECTANFKVRAMREGKAIYEKEILENNKRLCIFDLEKPAEADTVEVEVDATYGCDNARIFEIRLY